MDFYNSRFSPFTILCIDYFVFKAAGQVHIILYCYKTIFNKCFLIQVNKIKVLFRLNYKNIIKNLNHYQTTLITDIQKTSHRHLFESRSRAAPDICLVTEATVQRPSTARIYGHPIEILPNKHIRVKNLSFQPLTLPHYITLKTS